MNDKPLIVMYAVRNRDGKFFRAKGFGGYGDTWVDDLSKARIYARPGPARAQVTYFVRAYPSYGVPDLVELHVTKMVAVKETARVQNQLLKQAEEVARWEKEKAQNELVEVQLRKHNADFELNRLKKLREKSSQG